MFYQQTGAPMKELEHRRPSTGSHRRHWGCFWSQSEKRCTVHRLLLKNGIPQAPAFPKHSNLYTADLPQSSGIKLVYSNDLAILNTDRTFEEVQQTLTQAIKTMHTYYHLNIKEIIYLAFHLNREAGKWLEIKLNTIPPFMKLRSAPTLQIVDKWKSCLHCYVVVKVCSVAPIVCYVLCFYFSSLFVSLHLPILLYVSFDSLR